MNPVWLDHTKEIDYFYKRNFVTVLFNSLSYIGNIQSDFLKLRITNCQVVMSL